MMILILYFAISFVILYTQALDCYRCKIKFDLKRCLMLSILWPLSIPYGVYLVWKESEQ